MNELLKERLITDLKNTVEAGVNEQQFLIAVNETLKQLLIWDEKKISDVAKRYWDTNKELEETIIDSQKKIMENANKIYENVLKL